VSDDDVDRQKASAYITYILSPIRDFRLKFQNRFRSPFELILISSSYPQAWTILHAVDEQLRIYTRMDGSDPSCVLTIFDTCLLRYLCDTSDLFRLRSIFVNIWPVRTEEFAVGLQVFSGLYIILSTGGTGLSQSKIYWNFYSICFEMSFL
jgi:hypothetical protein